ncbi:MAG: RagB/SusD family nutrient uptake outer membrane protein [Rikenellaceae bacterium]
MKIIFKYISVALLSGALGLFTSCGNDFLDREPVSTLTPESYFSTDAQLRAFLMPLYINYIENHITFSQTGIYGAKDGGVKTTTYGTDDILNYSLNQRFVEGLWQVNTQTTSYWNFEAIYEVNYFLEYVLPKYEAGEISGTESLVEHCIGEAYWLRAYFYYLKWRDLGDFPIVTTILADDYETLTENSKRSPRNEVARFIISDLDKAAELMQDTPPDGAGNYLSKNVAYLLKSRVALFEASWLTNFKGTAFVPGGTGWPGAEKDYNSDFQYIAGSIDAEIDYFLGEAISASDIVASSVSLTPNTGVTPQPDNEENPYYNMFADSDMSGYDEVLFWRAYNNSYTTWKTCHAVNYFITATNAGNGMSRGLIMQYLDRKGLPWYASEDFSNDDDIFIARLGKNGKQGMDSSESLRDLRISLFLKNPGQTNVWYNSDISIKGFKEEPPAPVVNEGGSGRAVTGYLSRKGLNPDGTHNSGNSMAYNGCPIFRAAEAYLTYVEAYYMKYNSLGGNATTYWEAIRTRAGIDAGTIQTTIDALDMEKEAKYDWAAYTAGQLLTDKTLFAIRKERRSEFVSEGYRADDLRRWRAMDQMVTTPYHPQGFKLWGDVNYDLYIDEGGSTSSHISDKTMLIQYPASDAVVSIKGDLTDLYPEDGEYIYPYRQLASSNGFNGLIWKMAHYLAPLEILDFTLTATDGDLSTSPLYQNPYWPTEAGGSAIQ